MEGLLLSQNLSQLGEKADARRAALWRIREGAMPEGEADAFAVAGAVHKRAKASEMEWKVQDPSMSPQSIMAAPERFSTPPAPLGHFAKERAARQSHDSVMVALHESKPEVMQLPEAYQLSEEEREKKLAEELVGYYEPRGAEAHIGRGAMSGHWCLEGMVNMAERSEHACGSSAEDMLDLLDILEAEVEEEEARRDETGHEAGMVIFKMDELMTASVAGHPCSLLPMLGVSKGSLPPVRES